MRMDRKRRRRGVIPLSRGIIMFGAAGGRGGERASKGNRLANRRISFSSLLACNPTEERIKGLPTRVANGMIEAARASSTKLVPRAPLLGASIFLGGTSRLTPCTFLHLRNLPKNLRMNDFVETSFSVSLQIRSKKQKGPKQERARFFPCPPACSPTMYCDYFSFNITIGTVQCSGSLSSVLS